MDPKKFVTFDTRQLSQRIPVNATKTDRTIRTSRAWRDSARERGIEPTRVSPTRDFATSKGFPSSVCVHDSLAPSLRSVSFRGATPRRGSASAEEKTRDGRAPPRHRLGASDAPPPSRARVDPPPRASPPPFKGSRANNPSFPFRPRCPVLAPVTAPDPTAIDHSRRAAGPTR